MMVGLDVECRLIQNSTAGFLNSTLRGIGGVLLTASKKT